MDNTYKNIFYSSTATAFAEFATLPSCTIKTNFIYKFNGENKYFYPSICDITKKESIIQESL